MTEALKAHTVFTKQIKDTQELKRFSLQIQAHKDSREIKLDDDSSQSSIAAKSSKEQDEAKDQEFSLDFMLD